MIRQDLQCWFNTLSLGDRLMVQIFVVKLYGMETNEKWKNK